MSFFDSLFNRKKGESVVLIDINATSVAGAYVRYVKGEKPFLLYARRMPLKIRGKEPEGDALLRTLKELGEALLYEGAPLLVRAVDSGSVDSVLVSIDAPWQKTAIRTEQFEQNMPFIFNENLMRAALEKTDTVPHGQMLVDESVVGTILNGYETRDPYDKPAHRASIVILTSFIDKQVTKNIHTLLQSLYHTKNVASIAGSSLRYQAMRIVFPHEHDALILDVAGSIAAIALVRRGLLVEIAEVSVRTTDMVAWTKSLTNTLAKIAERFPLPRTIFLLTEEPEVASLAGALNKTDFGKLWLSDNPPKIVSVLGSHIDHSIRRATATVPDLSLLLMTLYFLHHKTNVQ